MKNYLLFFLAIFLTSEVVSQTQNNFNSNGNYLLMLTKGNKTEIISNNETVIIEYRIDNRIQRLKGIIKVINKDTVLLNEKNILINSIKSISSEKPANNTTSRTLQAIMGGALLAIGTGGSASAPKNGLAAGGGGGSALLLMVAMPIGINGLMGLTPHFKKHNTSRWVLSVEKSTH